MKIYILLATVAIILFVLASCFTQKSSVSIVFSEKINISAEIAESNEAGLMYRQALPENSGMLFVFSDDNYRTFWMKNTQIPLDIIFVSSNMQIVDIKKNFQPCTSIICEKYTSSSTAMYVIEVNANFTENYNISVGDTITKL